MEQPNDGNGFGEYRNLLLSELKRLNEQNENQSTEIHSLAVHVATIATRLEVVAELDKRITKLEQTLTILRIQVAGIAAIIGIAGSILGIVIAKALGI